MAKATLSSFPGGREIRPGVWELRAQLPRDPATGRYPQKSITHHGGRRSAKDRLAKLKSDIAAGKYSPAQARPGTVAELLEEYVQHCTTRAKPWAYNTERTARHMIDTHLVPALGTVRVAELTTLRIERAYRSMLTATPPVGRSTLVRTHAVLRGALSNAVRLDQLERNVAERVELGAPPRRKPPPFGISDVAKVIALAAERDQVAMATIIRVAAVTGARRGELCALRWEDIDLDAGTIAMAHNLVVKKGGTVIRKETKSEDELRTALRIDAGTVAVLRAWRRTCAETALAMGWSLGPATPVWRRPTTDEPVRPDTITQAWRRLADRARYPDVHYHDIRHASASRLVADGFDIVTVSERHGHADKSTTLNLYSHGLTTNDQRAADHLGSLLDAG